MMKSYTGIDLAVDHTTVHAWLEDGRDIERPYHMEISDREVRVRFSFPDMASFIQFADIFDKAFVKLRT